MSRNSTNALVSPNFAFLAKHDELLVRYGAQAERYSRGYKIGNDEIMPGGPWNTYKIPFLFATNGRPYLKQIKSKSGIIYRLIKAKRFRCVGPSADTVHRRSPTITWNRSASSS